MALYTERGRHWITLGTENYSFSLFCMNDCIVYETSSSRLTSCLLKLPFEGPEEEGGRGGGGDYWGVR